MSEDLRRSTALTLPVSDQADNEFSDLRVRPDTLTKARMADGLFEEVGLNKREAKEFVELFFGEIRVALARNEAVKISGFGNFDLRDKRERPGRNPKTGEDIPLRPPVGTSVRQKLKARVGAHAGAQIRNWPIRRSLAGAFDVQLAATATH